MPLTCVVSGIVDVGAPSTGVISEVAAPVVVGTAEEPACSVVKASVVPVGLAIG